METADRIMIVDDDQDIVSLFCDVLETEGIKVEGYTDPSEALQKFALASKLYPIVITDIRMPKLSGIELAKRFYEIDKTVKVFLMTAFALQSTELSTVKFEGLLEKPISIDQLKKTVNNALTGK